MEDFLEFVSSVMGEKNVNIDMPYKEGKWDSLMMLTLVMELEEKYAISIPIEKVGGIKKMADLYDLVKQLQ